MNQRLGQFLHTLHTGIALFVLFGWAFPLAGPWRWGLIIHFFFVPAMIAHWRMNNNRCFLTDIEYRLQGISPAEVKEADGFVKSLLRIFLKKMPSPRTMHVGIRVVSLMSWGITVYKLRFYFLGTLITPTVTVMHQVVTFGHRA